MPLGYYPRAGQILMTDFSGFMPPEINKIRPCIVVSPRLPGRSALVAVVPVSLTAPRREYPFHVRLSKNYHPQEDDTLPCWAKCDLLMNISVARLNGFKVGRRTWKHPQLSGADLVAVRHGIIYALGMGNLLKSVE